MRKVSSVIFKAKDRKKLMLSIVSDVNLL